jgi:hypothetical protein
MFETILEDIFLEFSQERKKKKKIHSWKKNEARASKWARNKTEEVDVKKWFWKRGKIRIFIHGTEREKLIPPTLNP